MASKRRLRKKCENKISWTNKDLAEAAIRRTSNRGPQHAYFCSIHQAFHIGHFYAPADVFGTWNR